METDENRKVSFTGAYDVGDYLYVSNGLFNGMLKLDKNTGEAIYLKQFPGERILQQSMHGRMFRYADDIIFTPDWIAEIHIYDAIHDELKSYPVLTQDGRKTRCMNSFVMDEKLWLFFSHPDQPVIIFDLKTHLQEKFYGIRDTLPKEIAERTTPAFFSEFYRVGNKLYGVVWNSRYVLEFDMKDKKAELYDLADDEMRLSGVAFDGEFFWLTELGKAHVIKWKPLFPKEIINLQQDISIPDGLVYCNIVCYDDKVILVPNFGNDIWHVDDECKELKIFCKLPEDLAGFNDVRKSWRRFIFHDMIKEDTLRLYPVGVNMMCDINLRNATIQGYKFVFGDNWKYKECIMYTRIKEESSQNYLAETREIDLGLYLDYVSDEKITTKVLDDVEENIGNQIWAYVMKDRKE